MAKAVEFCVTCTGPTATYICRPDIGGSKFANAGAKLLCIQQLANQFGHQKCAARRAEQQSMCLGKLVNVSAKETIKQVRPLINGEKSPVVSGDQLPEVVPNTAGPSTSNRTASPPRQGLEQTRQTETVEELTTKPKQAAPERPAQQQPPKTVEELAKRASQSSQENLEKAGEAVTNAVKGTGEAVGNVAKKTWDCLSTLLTDCIGK